jgi:hypothetical protein
VTKATEPDARPVRRWLVVAVTAVLVIVPGYGFVTRAAREGTQPRSEALFSFQMYSFALPQRYVGTDAEGATHKLSARVLPFILRSVNYGESVPLALCAQNPGLVSVDRISRPYRMDVTC